MSVIETIFTSGGATVNFHDEGYSGAAEELSFRWDNMLQTACQIVLENEQLRHQNDTVSCGEGR